MNLPLRRGKDVLAQGDSLVMLQHILLLQASDKHTTLGVF